MIPGCTISLDIGAIIAAGNGENSQELSFYDNKDQSSHTLDITFIESKKYVAVNLVE